MSTRAILSIAGRLVLGAAFAASSASCGSEMLRTGRAPVYLTIGSILAHNGATDQDESVLLSDVETVVEGVPTTFNDLGIAILRVTRKDPSIDATDLNAVTVTRYRVEFRRADGRNAPGVDVPYGFDGGATATIPADGEAEVVFDLVRHNSKREPPLRNLRGGGGQQAISTIAEVTFYGRDQNGNEVTVTGLVTVTFADFGDPK